MTAFLFGAGAAFLVVLALVAKKYLRRGPPGSDLSIPGREALTDRLGEDVGEIVDLTKEDRPESELAGLINEALK